MGAGNMDKKGKPQMASEEFYLHNSPKDHLQ